MIPFVHVQCVCHHYLHYQISFTVFHIGVKSGRYTSMFMSIIFTKETTFVTSDMPFGKEGLPKWGSTLKGKNLLLMEQILSFQN